MAFRFRPVKRRFIKDGKTQEKFFATAQSMRLIGVEELAKDISQRSAVKESSVIAVLMELSDSLLDSLITGNNVKFSGIGVFGVAITSEGFDTEKQVDARKVKFTKLTFRPDKKLVEKLKEMKFEKVAPPPKGYVTKRKPKPQPLTPKTPPNIQEINIKEEE